MGKIILDAELRKKLNDGRDVVEVYDESGQVVGHYLPHDEYVKLRYAEEKNRFTDEELAEARRDYRENGGVTTAEVLDHLRRLDDQLRGSQ